MTAEQLRDWRRKMGWTQPQAAERLGVHVRTLQRAERNGPSQPVALLAGKLGE